MHRRSFVFALAVVVSAAAWAESIPAAAAPVQLAQANQPAPVQPGRMQKFRERTKESWSQMKRRWSTQREKYAACRKEARAQRLAGLKTRHFLEDCMDRRAESPAAPLTISAGKVPPYPYLAIIWQPSPHEIVARDC